MPTTIKRPSTAQNQKQITFLYYRDLAEAMRFYEDILGLKVVIDQGWSKIYKVTSNGYVGLVDEAHGSHKANPIKPVQICIRVADVDAWHAWVVSKGVTVTKGPKDVPSLKIRIIVFNDPEGYQVEIQSVTD